MKDRKKKKENGLSEKGFLTLFLILVPSLIIAMASAINSPIIMIGIQVIALMLQLVVVKSFIEDYQLLRESKY